MYSRSLWLYIYCCLCCAYLGAGHLSENGQSQADDQLIERVIHNYVQRSKREMTQKRLDDAEGCVKSCIDQEAKEITNATTVHSNWIISVGLDDAKKQAGVRRGEKETRRHIQDLISMNMGPLFKDLCKSSLKTDECLKKCPASQLKDITIVDHNTAALHCEPERNWPNFKAYYAAADCNNDTIDTKPCDSKCGPARSVSGATHLDLDNNVIKYNTDVKTNTKSAAGACRSVSCHIDCLQPKLTEKCGEKAYDVFHRMAKLEPGSALAILQILQVIDPDIPDCQGFYKK